MITEKQLKILSTFKQNIFQEYTFKQIKEHSKEKSNSLIQNAIKKFKKEELITEKKIGTSKLYKLNHENDKIYDYLRIINKEQISKKIDSSIKQIQEELDEINLNYSLIIFGSYANKTNNEKSDLDLAIIISDEKERKNIKIALNSALNKTIIEIDTHIITEKEFLEMMKTKYENLVKQIIKKNLPIYNTVKFYKLILRGINNGFDPIYWESRKRIRIS